MKQAIIFIMGAGAWGTALAQVLSESGRNVTLYARDKALADSVAMTHENQKYLPGIKLNESIKVTADIALAQDADMVLMTTPTQFVRETLAKLAPHMRRNAPLVNGAKGIEASTGKILSEVMQDVLPGNPYVALSGPTFASEVARGLPTAITLASTAGNALLQSWAEILGGKNFRPYISHDPIGADIAGAVKNIIAIACGIVEGRKLGQNAKAAVMTRGMAEIKRFGLQKGAKAETFLGLSGIGDLMLTCHSMTSRNFSLGYRIGGGEKLEDIQRSRHTVAEGVASARAIATHAGKMEIDMPICLAVDAVLHEGARVEDIVSSLLTRDLKEEAI